MAAKIIDKLTPAQESQIASFRDEWLAIGLSTEPANRKEAELGADAAYAAAGLAAPTLKIWLQSPLAGAFGAHLFATASKSVRDQVWDQVGDQVGAQVRAQVRDQVWAQVGDQVGDQVRAQVRDQVGDQVGAQVRAQVGDQVRAQVGDQVGRAAYGQHDANWLGFYDFFSRVTGIAAASKLDGISRLSRASGWWWPFSGAVVLTERPAEIYRDDSNRLHNPSGAALRYRDDFAVWAIHGVRVDQQIIVSPETQTLQQINQEQNEEVKRTRIDRFAGRDTESADGWKRYLSGIGAKTIDHRRNDIENTREALMRTESGMTVLVCACPSTAKTFSLEVPPSTRTCNEAQSWLFQGGRLRQMVGKTRLIGRS